MAETGCALRSRTGDQVDVDWFMEDDKALAVLREPRGTVMVFLVIKDGRPVPVEVRAIPADSDTDFWKLLRAFKHNGEQAVSSTLIQNIPLGEIQRRWMTDNGKSRERKPSGESWFEDLRVIPERRLKVMYERCWVALRYEQLVMKGQPNPTQLIAEEVYGGDKIRARNVVSAARKDGWLTPATQGKPLGEVTEKALNFDAMAKNEMDRWARQSSDAHSKRKK